MPTNKTTQWRDNMRYEWRGHAVVDDAFENMDISLNADKIADWWIAKFATTLELLEKEVEERMNNLKCTCPVGVVCDCGVERAYQALSDVLAIIRQHKEK